MIARRTQSLGTFTEVAERVYVALAVTDDAIDTLPVTPALLRSAVGLPKWRAKEHVAVRALLAILLRQALNVPRIDAEVRQHPSGQPYLVRRPDICISLSHSNGYVAAAVAPGRRVGVDVQVAVSPSRRLLDRCCGEESPAIDALDSHERARRFARVWAAQEACSKVESKGLSGRPWTISVPSLEDRGEWARIRWLQLRGVDSDVAVSAAFGTDHAPMDVPTSADMTDGGARLYGRTIL
ncbi:4'-phosphopantetheinyl transferase superfamily protein [Arthrobacter sp. E44]|uniref:4'-phosphopantetheinyl transferase family protein n=1 Tax=Arthrobacter sp. E44 TaxID=3341794 RepID=UPI0035A5F6D7